MAELHIEEDFDSEPGHALIRLVGIKTPAGRMGFQLKRLMGEPPYLGAHGWQFDPCFLEPRAVIDSDNVTLRVGPEVVDHLAFNTPIEISLPDLDLTAEANWPDVAPSPGDTSQAGILVYEENKTPSEPPKLPSPAPTGQHAPGDEDEQADIEPHEQELQPPEPGTASKLGKSRLVAVVLAGLLAFAGITYWWLSGEPDEVIAIRADCSADSMPASASALLDYATNCQDQPDLAFNALRRCEEQDDNGACLMAFGRCYDPLHHKDALCQLDTPQGDIAGGYYLRADELSYPGADDAHDALCSHLEQSDPQSHILAGCL